MVDAYGANTFGLLHVLVGRVEDCRLAAGPHGWPVLRDVVIRNMQISQCAGLAPEFKDPRQAGSVIQDRLRAALDHITPLLVPAQPPIAAE